MPDLVLTNFAGMLPRVGDRLLPDNAAADSVNADTHTGELRGFKSPTVWHDFGAGIDVRRAFHLRQPDEGEEAWFSMSSERGELVKSPLVNDGYDRWYAFAPGQPAKVITFSQVQNGDDAADLAVLGPSTAPSLEKTNGEAEQKEDRVYAYSFVTEWGEESNISPTRTVKNCTVDATITITDLDQSLQDISGRQWRYTRIYRSIVGSATANMRFVADIDYGEASYEDEESNTQVALNDPLPPPNDPPPDGMLGARVHPSGALVAFKQRTVYFSRPYLPHSWPVDWQVTIPDEIVAIEILNQNVLVLTKGPPVILYGSNPQSIGVEVSPFTAPCLNYNSVVSTRSGVYYASEEGLIQVTGSGPVIVSDPAMTRQEWRQLCYTDQMRAITDGNAYIGFKADGTGFMFDVASGRLEFKRFEGLTSDPLPYIDRYLGLPGVISGTKVYRWNDEDGEEVDYRWKSKEFYLPDPENFEALQVELEPRAETWEAEGTEALMYGSFAYTGAIDKRFEVVVRVWRDRKMIFQRPVPNRTMVPLPMGLGTTWQVEIEGQCRVHRVTLTQTGKGQRRV